MKSMHRTVTNSSIEVEKFSLRISRNTGAVKPRARFTVLSVSLPSALSLPFEIMLAMSRMMLNFAISEG